MLLLSSLRTLDGRIEELAAGIRNNFYDEESAKVIKKRVEKLTHTRYCLILSLQDLKVDLNHQLDSNIDLVDAYLQGLHGTTRIKPRT